jgi:8-oxo-dGTP pyrophosphatase MutT (NUDIX family)
MNDRWTAPAPMLAKLARRLQRVLAPPASAQLPLRVEGRVVGWLIRERAQRLAGWRAYFSLSDEGVELAASLATHAQRTAAFAEVARVLAAEGALSAWRDERYAVAAQPGEPPLFEVERAAARYFGVHTFAAHLNGLVGSDEDWRMWLARRSPVKPIDPGLLDNLVGGGIAAGASIADTLVKEAWEEAGIDADRARSALPVGEVHIWREQPDGLQRETIHVHDLWLPADFVPENRDGEAVEHRLCTPDAMLAVIATDEVTADASLVIVDFLLRHGHVPPDDPSFAALDALRHPPVSSLHR